MNFKNKKGVSDVVTTVLIILLVLAAVAIVGSVVLRSVGNAGQAIDRNAICADPVIAISSCNYLTSSLQYIVSGVKKNSQYALSGNAPVTIEGAPGSVTAATWSAATFAANPVATAVSAGAAPNIPTYAFVTYSVTGPNGVVVGCQSPRVLCTTG